MWVCDICFACLAVDVDIGHTRVEWAWPDQGVGRDQVFETVTPHCPELLVREVRLELKDARSPAASQHFVYCAII